MTVSQSSKAAGIIPSFIDIQLDYASFNLTKQTGFWFVSYIYETASEEKTLTVFARFSSVFVTLLILESEILTNE